jgi:cytochrome c-type biogenesis protein CcmH
MIEFMLLSVGLLVVVMWLIVPTLFGKQHQAIDNSKHINISIARERLAELETQLEQGDINQDQYEQSRDEIESAMLDDADVTAETVSELPTSYKRNIFIMLSVIPFAAFGLYQYWGEPDAIASNPKPAASTNNPHTEQAQHAGSIDQMLAKLEARLAENPNDPKGWYMLGRSYMVQKHYDKATEAFRTLRAQVGDQPEVLLGLADAMTMARQGNMHGEPFSLVKRALELAPDNVTALWLAGLGYQGEGDLPTAINLWQKLLPLLSKDPESAAKVEGLIANAQQQLGSAPEQAQAQAGKQTTVPNPVGDTANAVTGIRVDVRLDPAMLGKVTETDYVMVYAQRVQGLKMPLAMVRAQVRDLPITVMLDDSTALSPMNKLSSEQQVNVIARVSRSGQATRQPGDIEVSKGPFPVSGTEPVSITIK